MRAIAVTGAKRLPVAPEVPTLEEQGIRGIDVHFWWGFVGPAGMPRPVVERLNAEIAAAIAEPELARTFANWNIETSTGTPEQFGAYIAQENARWREFVAKTSIRIE